MTDYSPPIRHARLGAGDRLLETVTHFPSSIEDVWPFFTDVENLERITPPELAFRIVTPTPLEICEGTLIDYRLRLYRVPFAWRTRISAWQPPYRFVDEQISGPYHTWRHEHLFEAVADGTRMTDRVTYRLPLHPSSVPFLPLVRRQLDRIFRYRGMTIRRLLVPAADLE